MLREELTEAMKVAMRNKDKRRLTTIRLVLAAIKDRDISMRSEAGSNGVEDSHIIEILSKMVKQRRESITAYEEAGRLELAEQEKDEMKIISEYLPKQMSEDEIMAAVDAAISETEATGLKDIGKIMALLKAAHAGEMDFAKASAATRNKLS